jgi:hypothetical protein
MSIQAHIDSLAEKRSLLKQQIAEELLRPMPDFSAIHALKAHNLKLKEEMQRYLIMLGKKNYASS